MKTIEVYRFDELPEDVQHEIHEAAGYMEDPWADENWDTWRTFIRDVFPYVIKDWAYGDRHTHITCYDNDWSEMHGEELKDYLAGILDRLGDYPTGYCMDYSCYGYVKNNLDRIVSEDLTAKEIAEDTFWHFCEVVETHEEYCQSFEYFAEEAAANDYYYTIHGEQVDV